MNYDAVIIGAATSGAYFAKKLASKGYSVIMLEALSKEKLGTRMDIFHVTRTDLKTYDIPQVKKGDESWAFEFTENHFSSPSNKYTVPTTSEIVGLHMHEYISLMVNDALEAGAKIEYGAKFCEFVFKKGHISGVRYETSEGIEEISCKVVIDCSGSRAVGRCSLPNGYGVENFELQDEDMFYVILRYAKFNEPQINTFWLNTKSWFAPFSMDNTEKVVGTGATGSFENAEKTCVKLDETTSKGEFTLLRTEKGTTPYRRPPYSLVADNFIVTGDAACLTKPDCGEGVTSSMVMMDIAADVLDRALKKGDVSKEALWEINREYNRRQGAEFSFVRAFLTKVVSAADSEIEYCFANGIIFNETFLNGGKIGAKEIKDVLSGITSAVVKKDISAKTIAAVASGVALGIALKTHYMNYPDSPQKLPAWTKKAEYLWKKVGKIG